MAYGDFLNIGLTLAERERQRREQEQASQSGWIPSESMRYQPAGSGFQLQLGGGGPPQQTLGGGYQSGGFRPGVGQGTPTQFAEKKTGGGFLPTIGKILSDPEVITGIAGTAANIYGAAQEGKARERELEALERERQRQEEERKRRYKLDQLQTMVQSLASFRPRY